jgi:hypothetical protein
VEPEETAVARQWLDKHVSMVMDKHAIIEELLETAFSVLSYQRYITGHIDALQGL